MANIATFARTCLAASFGLAACTGAIEQLGALPGPARTEPPETPPETTPPPPPALGPAPAKPVDPARCQPAPTRLWKLTTDQFSRAALALIPGAGAPGDELASTVARADVEFRNDAGLLDMSEPHVAQLFATARALAAQALAKPAALHPCLAKPDRACVRGFLESFLARAFRRPVAGAELETWMSFYDGEGAAGLEQVLTAVFLSPHFLYRTELGQAGTLTAHERAAALAFLLLDGPPDAELAAAATRNELATPAAMEAQARRLLARSDGSAGLMTFLRQHLQTDRVAAAKKDPTLFPVWTPELAADAEREAALFAEQALVKGDRRLGTLLTGKTTVVNGPLAALYGVSAPGAEFRPVTLPPERGGYLTLSGILAVRARDDESDAVSRGRFVREALLCAPLPPPPPGVDANFPPADGMHTQRERLARHSRDPACAPCHDLMDPIGLTLERFDAIGRHRTSEHGRAIDTRGAINGLAGGAVAVDGAVALGRALAAAPEASTCFVRKLFRYVHGRREGEADACALQRLEARFTASGGDVLDLLVAMVADESFVQRRM